MEFLQISLDWLIIVIFVAEYDYICGIDEMNLYKIYRHTIYNWMWSKSKHTFKNFEKKKYACPNKTASINKHTWNLSFNELVHLCGCWLDWMKETDRIMPYLICRQSMALKFMCTMRANNASIQHSRAGRLRFCCRWKLTMHTNVYYLFSHIVKIDTRIQR